MKKTEVVVYDDIHFKEENRMIRADRTITLGLNEECYELDLTNDHIVELTTSISRWTKSGNKVKIKSVRKSFTGTNRYNREMREFGEKSGLGEGIGYVKIRGGYSYRKNLRDAYSEYLAEDPE